VQKPPRWRARAAGTYQSDYSFAHQNRHGPQRHSAAVSVVTKELLDDRQAYRIGDVVKNVSG
jgi:flagellar basal body L-ring protein FlgH